MNLKVFLSAMALVPQLFTLVDSAVSSTETALHGFSGSDKLKAAEAKVNAVLQQVETDISVVSTVAPIIRTLIAAAVAAFNAAGIFKHAATTTASSATA